MWLTVRVHAMAQLASRIPLGLLRVVLREPEPVVPPFRSAGVLNRAPSIRRILAAACNHLTDRESCIGRIESHMQSCL